MMIEMYAGDQQIDGQSSEPLESVPEYSAAPSPRLPVFLPEDNWLETDWRQGTLVDLVDHIVFRHHAYARRTLPRLASRMNEVLYRHAELHPEILDLATTFLDFSNGLLAHMHLEERLLHSRIRELEASLCRVSAERFSVAGRPLLELVTCMESEHEIVEGALEHMRVLTRNFTPPAGASAVYRSLLELLAELNEDMQRHVYEENEVLFPRAIALEQSLSQAA